MSEIPVQLEGVNQLSLCEPFQKAVPETVLVIADPYVPDTVTSFAETLSVSVGSAFTTISPSPVNSRKE